MFFSNVNKCNFFFSFSLIMLSQAEHPAFISGTFYLRFHLMKTPDAKPWVRTKGLPISETGSWHRGRRGAQRRLVPQDLPTSGCSTLICKPRGSCGLAPHPVHSCLLCYPHTHLLLTLQDHPPRFRCREADLADPCQGQIHTHSRTLISMAHLQGCTCKGYPIQPAGTPTLLRVTVLQVIWAGRSQTWNCEGQEVHTLTHRITPCPVTALGSPHRQVIRHHLSTHTHGIFKRGRWEGRVQ